jgi:hypothetical protein
VQVSPHALQLVFVPRLTQVLLQQWLLEHWMAKVQLPLSFLVAQLVVLLSQYLPAELQVWLAEPHEPLPLHAEAFRVVRSLEHEGVAPHVVVEGLLVALHTGFPVEQSVAPVWQSVLMPSVHELPELQALQFPEVSHTPLVEPVVQGVATDTRLHVPVEHEWHVPQVVAQQIPEIQWPWVHWLSPEHGLPSFIVGVQAPAEPQ